ncbi:MAG: AAA family ATPase [Casimicrobiaceae bacterium]|nr:AAA family ATPase [Casimicrobiaceae bacterium]MCX8099492.1 AAA family ATPase [Casimicrobiaceae bacterium]
MLHAVPSPSAASEADFLAESERALTAVCARLSSIVLGKLEAVRVAVACLIAEGHLLIEDAPGLGKSTLAVALARAFGLDYTKVACTNDLLPSDLLGLSVWDPEARTMRFVPGPIFTQVLLADELNRAPSKTQSALLEAMEERRVSVDGLTRALPEPFFVIATQNPLDQVGVSPLPESQLDRFMMRLSLGYPDAQAELALLRKGDQRAQAQALSALLSPSALAALQRRAASLYVAEPVLHYVHALLSASRQGMTRPLSPRAGLALLRAARAWALLNGRDHVLPDDVQAVWTPVVSHRLGSTHDGPARGAELARGLLESVAAP